MSVEETQFNKVRELSGQLLQLEKSADQLQEVLRSVPNILSQVQTTLSALLPEIDKALAILVKQIMRLERNTPETAINLQCIFQYESFLAAATECLVLLTQLLAIDSIKSQNSRLQATDTILVLDTARSACRDISKPGGLLLDIESAESEVPSYDSHQGVDDSLPPAYEEKGQTIAYANVQDESTAAEPGPSRTDTKKSSSDGFLSLVASTFRAATSAMRTKPEPLVVPLCNAARAGSVSQIQNLVSEGVNVNGLDENGHTALICATVASQFDIVQFLLKAGASTDICNSGWKGKPPLFHAIDTEYQPIIDVLLAHGANANQRGDWQPYFVECISGETPIYLIELLLSRGADPNGKDASGTPVVILALNKRKRQVDREDVALRLLRHGADPRSRNIDGTPLVHYCAKLGTNTLAQYVLRLGADANAIDGFGERLLVKAIKNNDRTLVSALLKHGADANATTIDGTPALLSSLTLGTLSPGDKLQLAEMLLLQGADASKRDIWGVTALERALAVPILGDDALYIRTLKLLLKQGADPNQQLTQAWGEPTLLTYALEKQQRHIAEAVLSNGADPNLADKSGRVPLVLAMQIGDLDAARLLIKHGVDVTKPRERSPIEIATAMGNPEMIDLLRAHGAELGTN
ncbi:ankyrin repeat-containing domain protein [Xylariales sp. PMI_506]|nr:ankyrin repeat-containing domain protein [Xylariales sp. PMI_506]